MKKSLLALAVLGAFAGAASAQTNVTIYGLADIGLQRVDTNETKAKWGLDSGLKNGSRIGFKGSEDLGGGLSAIFTLENGFTLDEGRLDQGGRFFGRQAFVGLNGGFGTVKFGRQYTPIFTAVDSVDPFGTGMAGSLLNTVNTYGLRMDNTINYTLPNMGGFYGQVAYGFGEVTGDNSANRAIGLSVGYANGPINAVLAFHKLENAAGTVGARTTFLGGTYDFGVAKAHASFADNRNGDRALISAFSAYAVDAADAAAISAAADAAAFVEDARTRDYMLGVSAPVGAGNVMASFQRKDDRDSDYTFDLLAVGYVHNLSKRTSLYTSFGYGKADAGVAGVDDLKVNQFNVGLQHRF